MVKNIYKSSIANPSQIKTLFNEESRFGVEDSGDGWKGSKIDTSGIRLNYIEGKRYNLKFTLIIYIYPEPFSLIFITFGQKSTL